MDIRSSRGKSAPIQSLYCLNCATALLLQEPATSVVLLHPIDLMWRVTSPSARVVCQLPHDIGCPARWGWNFCGPQYAPGPGHGLSVAPAGPTAGSWTGLGSPRRGWVASSLRAASGVMTRAPICWLMVAMGFRDPQAVDSLSAH